MREKPYYGVLGKGKRWQVSCLGDTSHVKGCKQEKKKGQAG